MELSLAVNASLVALSKFGMFISSDLITPFSCLLLDSDLLHGAFPYSFRGSG